MYVTIYTKKVKRRKTGRTEVVGCTYRTKSLTPAHERIRTIYPDAQTYRDPVRIFTDFIQGMNLGTLPILQGGERIA